MTKAALISTEYLKTNTSIEYSVDDALLAPIIDMSQMTHIQLALGSAFYDLLQDQIVNDNLTAVNEALIRDYIQPALAKWTEYDSVPLLAYSMTNKSLLVRTAENADRTSLEEVKWFRQSIRDNAEFLMKRLNNELQINMTLYPVWASQSSLQNVKRNSKSFFNGIYLKGGGTDCNWGLDKPNN